MAAIGYGRAAGYADVVEQARPVRGEATICYQDRIVGQRFPQLGDCYQQSAPMAYGGNSKRLQIFGGEMAQVFGPDVILAECRLVAL